MAAVVEQGSVVGARRWGGGRRGDLGAIYRELEAVRGGYLPGDLRRRGRGVASFGENPVWTSADSVWCDAMCHVGGRAEGEAVTQHCGGDDRSD
jgi:hypothetical protein